MISKQAGLEEVVMGVQHQDGGEPYNVKFPPEWIYFKPQYVAFKNYL